MDIIVTTPKKEIKNANDEGKWADKNNAHWFRVFKFKPNIEIGDRVYFTMNGFIVGYGIVEHAPYQSAEGEECEVTNRIWGKEGDWVLEYSKWHWLNNQIEYKGFQGIRYVSNLKEDLRNKIIKEVANSKGEKK